MQENYIIYILGEDKEELAILEDAFMSSDHYSEVHCFINDSKLLQELYFLEADELPDLILLNDQKPLRGESQLVKHIRNNKKLSEVTIGIYSADLSKQRLEDLSSHGIDFYKNKIGGYAQMKEHIKEFFEIIKEKQVLVNDG